MIRKFNSMHDVWKYLKEKGYDSNIPLVDAFNLVYECALNDHDIITDEKTIKDLMIEIDDLSAEKIKEKQKKISELLSQL